MIRRIKRVLTIFLRGIIVTVLAAASVLGIIHVDDECCTMYGTRSGFGEYPEHVIFLEEKVLLWYDNHVLELIQNRLDF